jgi:hypothetical protein
MKILLDFFLAPLVLASLGLASCATVVRGVNEPFQISTNPPGAEVSTTLETKESRKARAANPDLAPEYYRCAPTPCEITLPRRSKFVAIIESEGFATVQIPIRSASVLSGQSAGIGGPTAFAVGVGVTEAATTGGFLLAGSSTTAYLAGTTTIIYTSPAIAVDAVSGGMLSLYPNPIDLTLTPIEELEAVSYDLDQLDDGNETWDYGLTKRLKREQQKQ